MKNISLLLIIVEDKFVLFKRSAKNKYFRNKYGLIGGMNKKNETNIEGVKRESFEEIGFVPNNIKYINTYVFYDKHLNVFYTILDDIKNIKLNNEHIDFKLFTEHELTNDNIIGTTNEFVSDYFKQNQTNMKGCVDKGSNPF